MHCRRLGAAGPASAYIAALPNAEFVKALPLHWPAEDLALLGGSSLLQQAQVAAKDLRRFYDNVVLGVLCARDPAAFPLVSGFGYADLCWAHAMYWSRAIGLDLPGGKREGLVHAARIPLMSSPLFSPLLGLSPTSMCNVHMHAYRSSACQGTIARHVQPPRERYSERDHRARQLG
mmetsp:Transcript_4312/g.9467  ORF Transcript_4312/g.9467 Transcript_4312/m.9467 type:complete len:176 (-) Transcript_4312:1205-1732(-)